MSQFKLDEVMQRVAEDAVGKADYNTELRNIHMLSDGKIAFIKTQEVDGPVTRDLPFDTTEWSLGQIFSKLSMPVQYFKRVKTTAPQLMVDHFNYWAKRTDGQVLLRARVRGDNAVLRGLVSDKYSVLDNDMTMDVMARLLRTKEDSYNIEDFYMDEKRMHLRLTYTDTTQQIGFTNSGKPDYVKMGMDKVNSEVGASSYNIVGLIWRQICSNGLRGWRENGDAFVQRHIFLRSDEFLIRVTEAMVNSVGTGMEMLVGFKKTMVQNIQNPFDVIAKIAKDNGYSKEFADRAKTEFEGDMSGYGVINSFTSAARSLPNERRLEVERAAGRLINLLPNQWARLDTPETMEDTNESATTRMVDEDDN